METTALALQVLDASGADIMELAMEFLTQIQSLMGPAIQACFQPS